MSADLAELILRTLDSQGSIADSRQLTGEHHETIKSALDSLAAKSMVEVTQHIVETWGLTAEGEAFAEHGSPEFRVWAACAGEAGKSLKDLQAALGGEVVKVGQINAFRRKWIAKQGDVFVQSSATVQDTTAAELLTVRETGSLPDAKALNELKRRTLTVARKLPYYEVSKGPKFSTTIEKLETDLTVELLQSGAWESANFKPYNFDAEGAPPAAGALHPLLRVREEFRQIFFELGFTEMPANRFVESSFWCFDALHVAQSHPARDLQDTFFVSDPPKSGPLPQAYLDAVRKAHEGGAYDSIGHRYKFSVDETERLVLRTHTTAVSAAMLYDIARAPGGFKPCKLFSIDRVFRNETVDATHLAEFHQVEGVVADYDITLSDLLGFMAEFFKKMNIKNLRYKPAFNPYTEPSLEIYSWHEGLKRWVEIGNSGIFRPEMLLPMGIPAGVRVLGWGLSVERPTMIKYGLSNIRDLVGHRVPLEMIERAQAVRFDSSV